MGAREDVASDLRRRLDAGEWHVGQKLPAVRKLADYYGVSTNTVLAAIGQLESDRLVRVRPQSGVEVVGPARPSVGLDVGREIRHDRDGYRYNALAYGWRPLEHPTRHWAPMPPHLAPLLGTGDADVLVRHRVLGHQAGHPEQIATTYLARPLADLLDVDDTGPGGWMQLVERELVPGPLTWRCIVAAGAATTAESDDLALPAAAPVLRLHFVITAHRQARPCAVDVLVYDATRYHVEYAVPRHRSARWPTPESTRRNTVDEPQPD